MYVELGATNAAVEGETAGAEAVAGRGSSTERDVIQARQRSAFHVAKGIIDIHITFRPCGKAGLLREPPASRRGPCRICRSARSDDRRGQRRRKTASPCGGSARGTTARRMAALRPGHRHHRRCWRESRQWIRRRSDDPAGTKMATLSFFDSAGTQSNLNRKRTMITVKHTVTGVPRGVCVFLSHDFGDCGPLRGLPYYSHRKTGFYSNYCGTLLVGTGRQHYSRQEHSRPDLCFESGGESIESASRTIESLWSRFMC
jgi:hypothetical protein